MLYLSAEHCQNFIAVPRSDHAPPRHRTVGTTRPGKPGAPPGVGQCTHDCLGIVLAVGAHQPFTDYYNVALAKRPLGQMVSQDLHYYRACTLVLTVSSRHRHALDRISWYSAFAFLRSIVVVWNAVDVHIPLRPGGVGIGTGGSAGWERARRRFRIPVVFRVQARNSLNNRFRPDDAISTDCVVNMVSLSRHMLPLLQACRGYGHAVCAGCAALCSAAVRQALRGAEREHAATASICFHLLLCLLLLLLPLACLYPALPCTTPIAYHPRWRASPLPLYCSSS